VRSREPISFEWKEKPMNSNILSGKWAQLKGKVREQWGKLTDDDVTMIDGKAEIAVGRLQERYGYEKERAEREWKDFYENGK
jgi:uncharacterized protein YjbJ (UPF0337 family)